MNRHDSQQSSDRPALPEPRLCELLDAPDTVSGPTISVFCLFVAISYASVAYATHDAGRVGVIAVSTVTVGSLLLSLLAVRASWVGLRRVTTALALLVPLGTTFATLGEPYVEDIVLLALAIAVPQLFLLSIRDVFVVAVALGAALPILLLTGIDLALPPLLVAGILGSGGSVGVVGALFAIRHRAMDAWQRSAREAAQAALEEQFRELRTLSRRLVDVQETERRHLARELHDEIGQALTGLRFGLHRSAERSPEDAALRDTLAQIDDLIRRVRDLSLELRPAMLDDLGLTATLQWQIERFSTATGLQIDFCHDLEDERMAPETETAAFRIVQEALTNVARHSRARAVRVELALHGDWLDIVIEDSGCGFDPRDLAARGENAGISGMRERTQALGGRFFVDSAPGHGTRIKARLPRASA